MQSKFNEINWPALNWFIHVLVKDVGRTEWVRLTDEELAQQKVETGSDYPYKVVIHPMPKGKDIVIANGRETIKIKCDSEYTRQLIVNLAVAYEELQRDYRHQQWERHTSQWHLVSDLPPHSPCSSFHEDSHRYFVYSSELCYVGGTHLGFRRDNQWYVLVNGKEVKHNVTHFRTLPPPPNDCGGLKSYEEVKEEVERLRKEFKYET